MPENSFPVYEEGKCILFALGRNAMYAACKLLGITCQDEILTPAFDCDSSLQPFRVLGCKITFFRSDPYTFSADISDIKKKINRNTKLIHIINHFGMPQHWNDLLALRQETGVAILEDNAYSLFSKFDGKHFGTFGDTSIFSLRKNLSLIDGGMLRINHPAINPAAIENMTVHHYPTEYMNLFILLSKGLLRKMFNLYSEVPPPLYSEAKNGYPYWPLRDRIGREFSCNYLRPMSRLARNQLERFSSQDYLDIISKKRQFYIYLSEKLKGIKGLRLIWPVLPEGIVPFCFSFLVEKKRDIFLTTLRKKYSVMSWPTLSKMVLEQREDFPEIELLGKKLLQINLPADKIRSPRFLGYMDSLVKDIHDLSKRYLA